MDYILSAISHHPTHDTRVLEVGCGEGGILLPFAEKGCSVVGIDISQERIDEARVFFAECHQQAVFVCQDFTHVWEPKTEREHFDVILVHDVIEHIAPSCKKEFLLHIRLFLKKDGVVFFGFPVWHNPFGGHQQICAGLASKVPFIHLLPKLVYRTILKLSGATTRSISELMDIRASRMTIERFERLTAAAGYTVCRRTHWLVNPHYKQKFHLKPRRQWIFFASISYLRNFYTTSVWYVLRQDGCLARRSHPAHIVG